MSASQQTEGYEVGQKPPGLDEKGCFLSPISEFRVTSFVDHNGDILSVDRKTGLLVKDDFDD